MRRRRNRCTYSSPCEGGETVGTSWIPENLAIKGKKIYFGKKTDKPNRFWTIISVGERESGEYLAAHERDYLTQRIGSDI